ncbi:AsmA family protein [Vitiosangium sp. GDMCC 1.1324]|uniref:AsmA family protein n=1 Tax=Vitiosangium sp. (strain GDMCC 1.1324) TaxID=2138576 RepID=UPI000D38EEE5|nr:AsmA family protein [Vitiosangium sp. GDMCC 1.1324]PTL84892.1 AsmA family protein [Vitiosangium sp. GDMCC 1.1324]
MSEQQPKKKRWPYVVGGIVLFLVIVVAVALWRLDAFLLQRARTEAAQLSQTLGRPVEIGGVSTQLIPHVGAEVENVVVGAAEGEQVPLAELKRVDVAVALWPALTSRGKDIQVQNVEVSGLTVNVVRLPDGTTNVTRLQEKLAQQQPKEEEPPAEQKPPTDLSAVRVDRAALTDATIRFIDRSQAQARELAISDLDVEVKDLRAGKPLEVVLHAAVLAQQQNFHLTVQTAPLPASLTPVPERVVLKSEPIDLTPLGPFLGPEVGLQAGTLRADWTMDLGAAVPGGVGPTKLQGGLRAQGLRFTGAEGGKALDVVLDTDVTGDMKTGDLSLQKLLLELGPARLTGKGQVKGLLTETPSVQDFELVGQNLDPAALAAYYPPLRKSLAQQVSGPIGLVVRGGGTQQAQALTADVDLTPVRLRIPEQLAKEAGTPMRLTARLTGAAASGGPLRFDAKADLAGVDMRPGLLLDKRPGQTFTVDTAGTYQPASAKAPLKVDLSRLNVALLDSTMSGTASVALAGQGAKKTTAFSLALKSPRLNVDELLMTDEEIAAVTGSPPQKEKPQKEEPNNPNRFNGMRGDMLFEIGALRMNEMDLSNMVAELKMVDDLVTVERFTTGVYGGTVSAGGSSVRLGPESSQRPFELKAEVRGMDVAQALSKRVPRKVLEGKFDGQMNLSGVGYETKSLQERLAGAIQGNLLGGVFSGMDIPAAVSGPLVKALPFTGKALDSEGMTRLADQLPFGLTIKNGVAQLSKPITWTRPEAAMSFDGGIRLDGTLDLAGTVNLGPPLIQKITLGRVKPTEPLPLALKLTGKAWSPEVTGLDVKPAALALAKMAASSAATELLGEKGKEVGKIINGGTDAAKQAAQAEADKRRKEAEERAKQEAEAARKKAEEEAKKRLKGLFGR